MTTKSTDTSAMLSLVCGDASSINISSEPPASTVADEDKFNTSTKS